tara:strand:- start:2447 stop:2692 length:246 start_codon:yes stop_codon:yes gene_type:complete
MNIDELILKIKDDELKEVRITKENGRYRGEIQLSDPTKKLSKEELKNVLRKLITEINLFSEDFRRKFYQAFCEKIYDEVKK